MAVLSHLVDGECGVRLFRGAALPAAREGEQHDAHRSFHLGGEEKVDGERAGNPARRETSASSDWVWDEEERRLAGRIGRQRQEREENFVLLVAPHKRGATRLRGRCRPCSARGTAATALPSPLPAVALTRAQSGCSARHAATLTASSVSRSVTTANKHAAFDALVRSGKPREHGANLTDLRHDRPPRPLNRPGRDVRRESVCGHLEFFSFVEGLCCLQPRPKMSFQGLSLSLLLAELDSMVRLFFSSRRVSGVRGFAGLALAPRQSSSPSGSAARATRATTMSHQTEFAELSVIFPLSMQDCGCAFPLVRRASATCPLYHTCQKSLQIRFLRLTRFFSFFI